MWASRNTLGQRCGPSPGSPTQGDRQLPNNHAGEAQGPPREGLLGRGLLREALETEEQQALWGRVLATSAVPRES